MITAEKCRKVASKYRECIDEWEDCFLDDEAEVNMDERGVVDTYYSFETLADCGTPMCHSGWYAAIKIRDKIVSKKDFEKWDDDYRLGADLLAKDLGFRDIECLAGWAKNNPCTWGNSEGGYMFGDCEAFESKTFDHSTTRLGLRHIVQKWNEVADNLEKESE